VNSYLYCGLEEHGLEENGHVTSAIGRCGEYACRAATSRPPPARFRIHVILRSSTPSKPDFFGAGEFAKKCDKKCHAIIFKQQREKFWT
jgi:hypothetical protein